MAENGMPQGGNRSNRMNGTNGMSGGNPGSRMNGLNYSNSNTGMNSSNDFDNQAAENNNPDITTPVAPEGGTTVNSGTKSMNNIPDLREVLEGGMPIHSETGVMDYISAMPTAPEGRIPATSKAGTMDDIPGMPVVPEEGIPVNPETGNRDNLPGMPVALEEGMPAAPRTGTMDSIPSMPSMPMAPEGARPVWPGIPSFPINPPSQYYGQVRFLNASTNSFPVNISVDNNTYAVNSRFATISNYDWISDGFHTITVRRATGLRTILLQQTFPFAAGQKVTMVLVDSGSGGLNMVRIVDTGCMNMPYNSGCYRIANMSYSGSNYDLMLYGGETIFRNVSFQEATPYKQALAGSYQFYLTRASNFTVIRELPVIIIGAFSNSSMVSEPLVSFQVDIEAGRNYTSYIIGNTWSDSSFRVMTVED